MTIALGMRELMQKWLVQVDSVNQMGGVNPLIHYLHWEIAVSFGRVVSFRLSGASVVAILSASALLGQDSIDNEFVGQLKNVTNSIDQSVATNSMTASSGLQNGSVTQSQHWQSQSVDGTGSRYPIGGTGQTLLVDGQGFSEKVFDQNQVNVVPDTILGAPVSAVGHTRRTGNVRHRASSQFGNGGFFGNQQPFVDQTPMRIRFEVGGLYLSHSGGDDTNFIYDAVTYAPLYTHSDINPGDQGAVNFGLLFQSDSGIGYELSYFTVDFSNSITVDDTIPVSFGAQPANLVETYTASYDSSVDNLEFNVFARRTQLFRFGFGFRYIDLSEDFDIVEGDVAGSGTGFFSSTDNSLLGAQFTGDLFHPINDLVTLEAGVKAGIFNNEVDVNYTSENRVLDYSDDTTSTVVDFQVGVAFAASEFLVLRIGYQSIVLDDVALAPNQSTGFDYYATSAPASLSELTLDGVYFGGTATY